MRQLPRILFFALLLGAAGAAQAAGEDTETRLRRGIALHDEGKFSEAVAIFRELLEAEPENTLAQYELAYSLQASGEFAECARIAERALKTAKSTRVELFTVSANCLDAAGEPKKALKVFKKGHEEFPDDSNLAFNYALTQYLQGHYRESRKLVEIALAGRPSHASSYRLLAAVYQAEGHPVPALLAALRFLSIEPASQLSADIARQALQLLNSGVRQGSDGNVNVTVAKQVSPDGDFTTLGLLVSIAASLRYTDEYKGKPENELLAKQIETLLGALTEDEKLLRPGTFVADRLVIPLAAVHRAGLDEVFAYLVFSALEIKDSQTWLANHGREKAALERLMQGNG